MNILLTGVTGFVGSRLFDVLSNTHNVSLLTRNKANGFDNASNRYVVGDFLVNTDYSSATKEVDCVVHVAAKAHITNKTREHSLDLYRATNTGGTLSLAKQAAVDGVRRFIFISSIGVNGFKNEFPFTCFDIEQPFDHYAQSKFEAEIALRELAEDTGMEVVIIRPPLVYGKGAPGNFGTLLKVSEKNLPLPLGRINNQRSFVAVDNLVDLIKTCIDHPSAANQTFLAGDDEDISTSDLLKKLTFAAGKKPCLLPVPVPFLKLLASIIGKKATVDRFTSSLTVDIDYTKKTLNWKPPISLDEGIRRCFK